MGVLGLKLRGLADGSGGFKEGEPRCGLWIEATAFRQSRRIGIEQPEAVYSDSFKPCPKPKAAGTPSPKPY